MLLDLSKPFELNKFLNYAKKLQDKKAKVELKEKKPGRSIAQNSYFHVVITLYSIGYGSSINETKVDLKRDYGLFYTRNGNKYLISSADLDSKQMTDFIDWIRTKSSKDNGYYIPTSEEYLINKFSIDKEMENYREFM